MVSQNVVVATLNNTPALEVWSVNELDMYQGVPRADVEHVGE